MDARAKEDEEEEEEEERTKRRAAKEREREAAIIVGVFMISIVSCPMNVIVVRAYLFGARPGRAQCARRPDKYAWHAPFIPPRQLVLCVRTRRKEGERGGSNDIFKMQYYPSTNPSKGRRHAEDMCAYVRERVVVVAGLFPFVWIYAS